MVMDMVAKQARALMGLTPPACPPIVSSMDKADAHLNIAAQIKALDARLGALLKRAGQMRRQTEKMAVERARLMIVQEQVRTRIKAMICELKTIERDT